MDMQQHFQCQMSTVLRGDQNQRNLREIGRNQKKELSGSLSSS